MSRGDHERTTQLFYLWLRVLGLATLGHIYLPDYEQSGWLIPRLIGLVGGLCLILAPLTSTRSLSPFHRDLKTPLIGVCLSLAACKVYTILGHRDVLTQSLLLTTFYLLGAWGLWRPRSARYCLRTIVWCVSLTYGLAVLHKLNTDFLYTAQSCAIHGVEVALSLFDDGASSGVIHPYLKSLIAWATAHPTSVASCVLGLEWSLALLCWRHSRWIWGCGYAFHIPLTLTIAPAFGSVMAAGWSAGSLLGEQEYTDRSRVHRRAKLIAQPVVWIAILYGLHGLSPYIGIEVQHSAAMLSNLRVDPQCANSVVMPHIDYDPYIYLDEVHLGSRLLPRREEMIRETLWNLAALHAMRRNWCIPENRPLYLKGSYRGESLRIKDLCAPQALDHLDQQSVFPSGWQRYQKNLSRECHAACVH